MFNKLTENWLQKISQFKDMPVPHPDTIPEYNKQQEYGGHYNIDTIMTEETARSEESKHDFRYLGDGMMGLVFHKNGRTYKYVADDDEVAGAERAYENPLSCIANVLEPPRMVQEYPKPIWLITMEKVELLNDFEQDVIRDYRNKIQGETYNDIILDMSESQSIIQNYDNLVDCLETNSFGSNDAHAENIGYDSQGNLVLFDLGGSYYRIS